MALEWRAFCRALAQERAAEEERLLWKWEGRTDPVPMAHRWEHVQDVVRLALWLAAVEGATAEGTRVIEAAAWRHDIRKLEPRHAEAAAAEVPALLARTDFPAALVARVADTVAKHEGMTRPEDAPPLQPLEAAILWDADKLSKLGAGALAMWGGSPYDAGKPLADRCAHLARWARGLFQHTGASMNTPAAQIEARRRLAALLSALAAWEEERLLGAPPDARRLPGPESPGSGPISTGINP